MKTRRPATIATNGMVATPHYLASQAGLHVLRVGGNAIDAAIAANAVLTVVMPDSCAIGGDAFFMVWDPAQSNVVALNGSGRAGAGLTADAVRSSGHDQMPGRGPLTVTVPGTIEAWEKMLTKFGRLDFSAVLADAIRYARDGFVVTPRFTATIETNATVLKQNPTATAQFLPGGKAPRPGMIVRQPDLAKTLEKIGKDGADAFYRGEIGERIAANVTALGGQLTIDDLSSHSSNWVDPITTSYRGFDLLEMPPNTQGITALQLMNIAEGWDIAGQGANSVEQIHHFVEAKKFAFADRDRYISDPEFVDIPIERLISKEYAAEIRSKIDSSKAQFNHADPPGAGGTIYMCVVDNDGMAVSLIQSVFKGFGSGVIAEGTGVLLQNRGASFTLDESAANSLQPGKRPMHTLIPGMVLQNGRPWSVFGTMGGHGQAQTHLQMLTRMIDHGYDPQQTVESARWVAGRSLDEDPEHVLRLEPEIGQETLDGLRALGHDAVFVQSLAPVMGHAQAIRIDHERGTLCGGADPRADGYALGW